MPIICCWTVHWLLEHVPFEEILVRIKDIRMKTNWIYFYEWGKTNWLPAVMNYKSNTEVGASNADCTRCNWNRRHSMQCPWYKLSFAWSFVEKKKKSVYKKRVRKQGKKTVIKWKIDFISCQRMKWQRCENLFFCCATTSFDSIYPIVLA